MNLAELLAIPASMFPEQEILTFEDQTHAYEVFQERVARTGSALRHLGVEPGDRVAALQTNTSEVLAAMYATAAIGGVFVPLNYRARSSELRHMLAVAQPRVVLAGDRYVDLIREVCAGLTSPPLIVAIESPVDLDHHLPTLAAELPPAETQDVDDDALAVLLFTSGTTAAAKAVMLSHDDLVSFVFNTTDPADGSDRGAVLVAAPLYHIAGLSAALAATFAGRRVVLTRQFESSEWLRIVAAERITHAFLVPTMLSRVLADTGLPSADLSSLQVLSYGAAPMPMNVIRRAIEVFPKGVQFLQAFGQTETTASVTVLGPDDHRLEGTSEEIEKRARRLASVGRPLPDVQLRIADEAGLPLGTGAVGEVWIRAERTMRGYYGLEDATARVYRDGWLRTGDLGWLDEDGYLFLTGRQSDMIIRGGENIAPEEIEIVLGAHPEVEEAAVIGLPDEEWGERVGAVVVRKAQCNVSADDLAEFCRSRLASFKKPEAIFFRDALPRNSLGKLLRSELRETYRDQV